MTLSSFINTTYRIAHNSSFPFLSHGYTEAQRSSERDGRISVFHARDYPQRGIDRQVRKNRRRFRAPPPYGTTARLLCSRCSQLDKPADQRARARSQEPDRSWIRDDSASRARARALIAASVRRPHGKRKEEGGGEGERKNLRGGGGSRKGDRGGREVRMIGFACSFDRRRHELFTRVLRYRVRSAPLRSAPAT